MLNLSFMYNALLVTLSLLFLLWFFAFPPIKKIRGIIELDTIEETDAYEQEEICRMPEMMRDKIGVRLGDIVTVVSVNTGKKTNVSLRRITEDRRFTTTVQLTYNKCQELFGDAECKYHEHSECPDENEKERIVEVYMSKKQYIKYLTPSFLVYMISVISIFYIVSRNIIETISLSIVISLLLSSLEVHSTDFSEPFFNKLIKIYMRLKEYIVFNAESSKPVVITAPHAHPPLADKHTGKIAELVAKKTGATAVIGMVSRLYIDLNRSQSNSHPFRKRLKKIIEDKKKPMLLLDLHGTKTEKLELGSANGLTASKEVVELVKGVLSKHLGEEEIDVIVDERFKGSIEGTIIRTFGSPEKGVHAIQIELPQILRRPGQLEKVVEILSDVIQEFENRYSAINLA